MKIKIVCVGRSLSSHEQAWIDDYVKRAERFTSISIVRIRERVRATPAQTSTATWNEIAEHIPKKAFTVLLDSKGKQYSTEDLRNLVEKTQSEGIQSLVFVIGGSYGIPADVLKYASSTISFSKLTLPHRIALLVLVEQLYRVFSWKSGAPYHHA